MNKIIRYGNFEVNPEWHDELNLKMSQHSLCGMELAKETEHKYKKYQKAGYTTHNIRFRVADCDKPPDGPWKHAQCMLIDQGPGNMLPIHVDELEPYRKKYNLETLWQNLIFLEDWKCGQVFGVEDEVITNWKQGDAICWKWMTEHYLVNASLTHIRLLQILSSNDPTQEIHQKV